jgi:hypothetical protein
MREYREAHTALPGGADRTADQVVENAFDRVFEELGNPNAEGNNIRVLPAG